MSIPNSSNLQEAFAEAKNKKSIGGSSILENLAGLARSCVEGGTTSRKAVAFALAHLFETVAEDRSERPVSGNEHAALYSGVLDRAVAFVESPGDADQAVEIIAAIADMERDLVPMPS